MIVTLLSSAALSAFLTWLEILYFRKRNTGQAIREEGPQSHLVKAGTPTMGGIAMIIPMILGMAILGYNLSEYWITLLGPVLFGIIGFYDDYKKISKNHNQGLTATQKIIAQLIFAIALAEFIYMQVGSVVWIPIFDVNIDFGFFYIPFMAFVIIAMVNAVNLTDGLDGLAAGSVAIVSLFFVILALFMRSIPAASFTGLHAGTNMFILICGACLGFLIFNKNPAKIFMGDTGSLALGGGIAAAAAMMKLELLLPVAGFIFVAEALSVVIQVLVFKRTGKRVFRMAPLHHHFEEGGSSEQKVVLMFWGVTVMCCVLGWLVCLI